MSTKAFWTTARRRKLRELYSSHTDAEVARRMRTTADEVDRVASEMALAKDKAVFEGQTMPRWTDEELETLRFMHRDHSNLQIARALGRSAKSVASKANSLGLKKSKDRLEQMGRDNRKLRTS
jgi:DNA-binding NarL/FixJ family response regulator